MKKGTVIILWFLLVIFVLMVGLIATIKDVDSEDDKQIGARVFFCVGAAALACWFAWGIGEDKGKKEAKEKYWGEPIIGFPERGEFKVLNQRTDENDWRFLRLKDLHSGKICCYASNIKLLDQDGKEITESVPKIIEIYKHEDVEIIVNEEQRFAKSNPAYYIFPLTDKGEIEA